MKCNLFALVTGLLFFVGCGGDAPNDQDIDTVSVKMHELEKSSNSFDLDDPKTLAKVIEEAIIFNKLNNIGNKDNIILRSAEEKTPYTGWSKRMHPNGKVKSLMQINHGSPDRLIEWFENGQKQMDEIHEGAKILTVKWHRNGNLAGRTSSLNAKHHGLWSIWHENGKRKAEVNWKNGEMNGLQTFWYEDGQKKEETFFINSLKNGPRTEWYKNGQTRYQANYIKGRMESAVVWKPNAKKCPITFIDEGEGIIVNYNQDGTEMNRIPFPEGAGFQPPSGRQHSNKFQATPQMPSPAYYENGQRRIERNIKYGQLVSAISWKPNGERCNITNINQGNGILCEYHDNGVKKNLRNYREGIKHGTASSWYKNGQKQAESNWKKQKKNGPYTEWYENGQKKTEKYYSLNQINGTASSWYMNGQKRTESNQKNGIREGTVKLWHENGQILVEEFHQEGRLVSLQIRKPNGEICPVSKVDKNGDGLKVFYKTDGTESSRAIYKNGIRVLR